MSFQATQNAFMQHIRDPENNAFPDIEDRRLAIYRELFFNNVEGFVSSAFPVLHSLYSEDDWLALVRKFFSQHDCKSPYFLQISEEFMAFLSNEYQRTDVDPEYMLELAHYEWVELALSIADQDPNEGQIADIQTQPMYFSSLAWRVSYAYPVQFASSDNPHLNVMDEGNHLVIYRDNDDEIQFVAINGITAHLLQQIESNAGISFAVLLEVMQSVLPQVEAAVLESGLETTLLDLAEKGVLVTK
jgi:hypothetical protein